jgi:hypothetical protein
MLLKFNSIIFWLNRKNYLNAGRFLVKQRSSAIKKQVQRFQ